MLDPMAEKGSQLDNDVLPRRASRESAWFSRANRSAERRTGHVPEHAQQPTIEAMEEAGHDGSWAHQRGHSAARPNGEWRLLQRDGDGEAAEPVESENGSAAGMAWLARGWAQRRESEKKEGCANDVAATGNSRAFGAECARTRAQVSAVGSVDGRREGMDGKEGYITAPVREPHTTGGQGSGGQGRQIGLETDGVGGDGRDIGKRQASKPKI